MASNIDEAGVKFVVQGFDDYIRKVGEANDKTTDIGTKTEASATKTHTSFTNMAKYAAGFAVAMGAVAVGVGTALLKIAGDFDDAQDAIAVGTGATGKDLDGLEKSFEEVFTSIPADGGDIAKAMTAINQKTGATGKPLETLTAQIVELSRITGTDLNTNIEAVLGATQRWGLSASATAPFLDELFRISQESGVPVADLATALKDNKDVLDGLGLPLNESAILIGALGKSGVDADTAFGGLRFAMTKMAKEGVKDPKAELEKYFDRIKNAKTPTEATAIAVQAFGRQGVRMASAIRDGSFDLGAFTKAVGENKNGIIDTARETDDWKEKLTILKNQALVELKPVAERVFKAVGDAVDAVKPALEAFRKWFAQDIEPPIRDLIRLFENDVQPALAGVLRFAQTVLQPGIKAVFTTIGDYIRDVVNVFTGVIELINALVHGRWGEAWDAVKKVATAVFDAIAIYPKYMFRLLEGYFGDGFRALGAKIGEWMDTYVLGPIKNAAGFAAAAAGLIADFAGGIKDGLGSLLTWLGENIDSYVLNPIKNVGGFFAAGIDLIADLAQGLKLALGTLATNIVSYAKSIGSAIFGGITSGLGDLASAIWDWVKGAINTAIGYLEGGVNGIINAINRALEFSISVGPVDVTIDPPDIPSISLPRVGGSGGITAGGGARGGGAASVTTTGVLEGGSAGSDVLNRLVDVLGRIANALPSVAQQSGATAGGTSYIVTVNNAMPQVPASIRADLTQIAMKASG